MRPQKLTAAELTEALDSLPAWQLVQDGSALHRSFRFADFRQAFAFMGRVAEKANELDHHPDWSNSYARVEVTLSTHDAGGLTALDLELARFCDKAATS